MTEENMAENTDAGVKAPPAPAGETPASPVSILEQAIKKGVSSGKAEPAGAMSTGDETDAPLTPRQKKAADIVNRVSDSYLVGHEADDSRTESLETHLETLADSESDAQILFASSQELGMSPHELAAVLPEGDPRMEEVQMIVIDNIISSLPEPIKEKFLEDAASGSVKDLKAVLQVDYDVTDTDDPARHQAAVEAAARLPFPFDDPAVLRETLEDHGYSNDALDTFLADVARVRVGEVSDVQEPPTAPGAAPVAETTNPTDASDGELSPVPTEEAAARAEMEQVGEELREVAEQIQRGEDVDHEEAARINKKGLRALQKTIIWVGGPILAFIIIVSIFVALHTAGKGK